MSTLRVSDTATLVRLLSDAQIELIVVGMSAAVLMGVPATTLDLDIVHRRTPENIQRLEALAGRGHHNLQTKFGPLDLLARVAASRATCARRPMHCSPDRYSRGLADAG